MFPVTLTISNIDQLTKVMAALNLVQAVDPLPAIGEAPAPEVAKPVGKPAKPAEAPAPSPPTATEAVAAAPAPSTTQQEPQPATAQPAAAGSAFDYATLAKAVNERITKVGKDKLLAIAKAHGAETFKTLPADKWEAAYNDVTKLEV